MQNQDVEDRMYSRVTRIYRIWTTTAFVILALTICSVPADADTLIVNNRVIGASGPIVFETVAGALDAAADGDTIQVTPSPIWYGDTFVGKPVTLIGGGFRAVNQDVPLESVFGGAFRIRSSGVALRALRLEQEVLFDSVDVSSITIDNCLLGEGIRSVFNAQVDGLRVTRSIVLGRNGQFLDLRLVANVTFAGCLIQNGQLLGLEGALMDHNLWFGPRDLQFSNVLDVTFSNNIILSDTAGVLTGRSVERCVFTNNWYVGATAEDDAAFLELTQSGTNSGSGNRAGIDPMIVDQPENPDSWTDYDFRLQPSSPALGTASNGRDPGPSDGSYPFDSYFDGGSLLPVIETLNTSSVVLEGEELEVRVKARVR